MELRKKYKILVALSAILIATSFIYMPALENGFTWDDEAYVVKNSLIKPLSFKNINRMFTEFYIGNYHPLTLLSFALEYHFFKLHPAPYHATNILIHLTNCVLVFLLIYMISSNIAVSWFVGLLFGIHPLHVESVAWVSGRKDVLYALFFLASLISYIRFLKKQDRKYYYFSLILFLFSLLSKSMAVTLPLVIILLDYFLNRKISWASFRNKIPFFFLSLCFGILALLSQQDAIRHDYTGDSPLNNILVALHGLLFYLEKTFFPVKLSALYMMSTKHFEMMATRLIIAPFIVGILIALIAYSAHYTKKIVFACLFYFITLLPVLQLIPVGHALAADRYTYVPLIGIFYIVGEGLLLFFLNKKGQYLSFKKCLLAVFVITALFLLSSLAVARVSVWKDGVTLWQDAIENHPLNSIAYNNRGAAFYLNKEYAKALEDFKKAIEISPSYDQAHANLCRVYAITGYADTAISVCQRAIQINPRMDDVYNFLGSLIFKKDVNAAIFLFKKAVAIRPSNENAYANLCGAFLSIHDYVSAEKACEKAIALNPELSDAYVNLGNVYMATNRYRDAAMAYAQALELNPDIASAHGNLGTLYLYAQKYDLAVRHIDRAIELGQSVHPDVLKRLQPYRKQ